MVGSASFPKFREARSDFPGDFHDGSSYCKNEVDLNGAMRRGLRKHETFPKNSIFRPPPAVRRAGEVPLACPAYVGATRRTRFFAFSVISTNAASHARNTKYFPQT
jgi:hypothetical protein